MFASGSVGCRCNSVTTPRSAGTPTRTPNSNSTIRRRSRGALALTPQPQADRRTHTKFVPGPPRGRNQKKPLILAKTEDAFMKVLHNDHIRDLFLVAATVHSMKLFGEQTPRYHEVVALHVRADGGVQYRHFVLTPEQNKRQRFRRKSLKRSLISVYS